MNPNNLLQNIPKQFKEEIFEDILKTENFKLERIISKGHVTAHGQWYDQDKNEWVLLIQGEADLKIEGQVDVVTLREGDHILLAAHQKHRVERTHPQKETIWLALHF